jgi:hypothetical protein
VVIVNDAAEAYCPVLGLDINEFQCEHIQGANCNKAGAELKTRINYYNPYSGIWEPILEVCQFQLDYYFTKDGDTETICELFFSDRHPVNFNIS